MKYVDEFRDAASARRLAAAIAARITRPWTLMEICGGQTHSLLRHGIDQMLPEAITLLHGPAARSASRRRWRSTRRSPSPPPRA